jgi:hypothetical protein
MVSTLTPAIRAHSSCSQRTSSSRHLLVVLFGNCSPPPNAHPVLLATIVGFNVVDKGIVVR